MKESEDIQNFGQYADDWWSNKTWAPLLKMNRLRIPFLQDCLLDVCKISEFSPHKKFPLDSVRILDVGCGGGFLSEGLAKKGAETTGIDPSADLIRIATVHSNTLDENLRKPRYFAETIKDHATRFPEYYDCVICSEVIEHVDMKEEFLADCLRALKPGGSLIITTPHKTLFGLISYIIYAEYVVRITPKGTHEWSKFISLSQMKTLMKKNGCKVGRTEHLYFNPMSQKWYLSWIVPPFNYTGGN